MCPKVRKFLSVIVENIYVGLLIAWLGNTNDVICVKIVRPRHFQNINWTSFMVVAATPPEMYYSRTSVARTLMSRLPRLFRTRS